MTANDPRDGRQPNARPLKFPLAMKTLEGKTVVLGLVTSKAGALESVEDLQRRIADAAKYVPLDQLCLSPQCGFASTFRGNPVNEDGKPLVVAVLAQVDTLIYSAILWALWRAGFAVSRKHA